MVGRKKAAVAMVIDSDGVSDDVRAISLALQNPNVEVLALTAVNGCVSVGQACANLARTLRANNREGSIPIYKGAELPLIGNGHTHLDEVHFFGTDGLGNAPNDFPKVLPGDFDAHVKGKHAAVALCELFEANPGTILVCIGPLTNVALALKLRPAFAKLPAKIVALGGNVYGMGNVRSHSTAEFNFSNDPEAAHIVLKEMQCPLTVVPWETFLKESERSAIDFHAHLDLDFPLAKFFATAVRIGRSELERNKKQFAFCDEIAVGVAIDPEGLVKSAKMLRASVELHGQLTRCQWIMAFMRGGTLRGQVAVDWVDQLWNVDGEDNPKVCKGREPVQFVMDYDVQRLDQMLTQAIHNSALGNRETSAPSECQENAVRKEMEGEEDGEMEGGG